VRLGQGLGIVEREKGVVGMVEKKKVVEVLW
jgi:hypothetical protein